MSSSKSLQFLSTFRHQANNDFKKFKSSKGSVPSLQVGASKVYANAVLIYFDNSIAFVSHLKLGKNVLERKVSQGVNGTIVRTCSFPDFEGCTIRGEMEDYDEVMWNIRDILGPNTANRAIVFMIRDPYQKVLSAVAQISISNIRSHYTTSFNFLTDKFKKHNRFYYQLLEKIKLSNLFENEDYTHKFYKRSIYFNALVSYFDFVIKKYNSLLFLDNHLTATNIANVYHILEKCQKNNNSKISLINLDSRKEEDIKYINDLYRKYGITDRDLLLRDVKRHSNFIFKPMIKHVLENLPRDIFLPFYLYLNPEYFYLKKINTEYRWAMFNKKLLS